MKVLVLLAIFIITSCTILDRRLASFEEMGIKKPFFEFHKICPEKIKGNTESCYVLKASVSLLSQREKVGTFRFPLRALSTPFYNNVPFYIKIDSDQRTCRFTKTITPVSSNIYKVLFDEKEENNFSCRADNLKFSYIIPSFDEFPVSEAEWMNGFFPNIVSHTELKLSQIYDKWMGTRALLEERFQISDGITYRGRELLLKYANFSNYEVVGPKKFSYQFEKEIFDGDMLIIKDIKGSIEHPRFGITGPEGYQTANFKEKQEAGNRYLRKTKVRAYEFFCEYNGKLIHFREQESFQFANPGKIRCSINTKKKGIFNLGRIKGHIEFNIQYMNIKESIKRIPKQVANSQVRIRNRIKHMNKSNIDLFENLISKQVDLKEQATRYELEMDKEFPASIFKEDKLTYRDGFKICGVLKRDPSDFESEFGIVEISELKAFYGKHEIVKKITNIPELKTRLSYFENAQVCFPISAQFYVEGKYINAVLFYEP